MNVDTNSSTSYSFRDKERNATGIAMFHCLMAKGDGLYGLAEERGYSTAFNPDKDYRMTFTDGAALTEGDSAKSVTLTFHLQDSYKKSQFAYNEETGLYEFTQYGNLMVDANNGETVAFRNLFFLSAETWTDADGYHVSTLIGSGEGWFACDGYMVPIQWHREADTEPFSFTLADGTPLVQGVGSSYVAIAPTQSTLAAE